MKNKKILISHSFGIGDIIMAIPMLKYLKNTYPDYQIDLFTTNKAVADIMTNQPYFKNIYYSKRNPLSLLKKIFSLRWKKYDFYIVTAVSKASKTFKHGIISCLINAKQRIGEYIKRPMLLYTKKQKFSQETHKVLSNINLARLIGDQAPIDTTDIYPELFLDEKTEEFGRNWYAQRKMMPNRTLIVHIGSSSGGKHRRWDRERFKTLIFELKKHGWFTVIVSGADELEESTELAKETVSRLLSNQTLLEVYSVMKRAHAFINADSGLSHLASAANIKVFSLFGPGDERKTAPFAKESYIIRNHESSCQRCLYPHKKCTMECLLSLSTEYVYEQILPRLQKS
ncbi:MAG: glycosyltransferase family 9 protein [Candidatus Cloacimonadales bacterium]|jgi:ADP-heptose:LPS heptosyltransferase|nr:glycosyltransferase family 9 protein [Candidatus Cloacimonadota bacterium]MDD2650728.1 glycosyltransferase family 9 protein [Candidatus Cloacimonadota bacterium]MDX9977633.1 glycosyltransferase family 9 protein [Candidatus Cloacimonadales bacterium]